MKEKEGHQNCKFVTRFRAYLQVKMFCFLWINPQEVNLKQQNSATFQISCGYYFPFPINSQHTNIHLCLGSEILYNSLSLCLPRRQGIDSLIHYRFLLDLSLTYSALQIDTFLVHVSNVTNLNYLQKTFKGNSRPQIHISFVHFFL